jgi:acyl-CoA hydrolase
MTALPGVASHLGIQPENSLDGFSRRSETGKVISRKKNVYQGNFISTFAAGPHAMCNDVAESPTVGLSPRTRLNISSAFAESLVR